MNAEQTLCMDIKELARQLQTSTKTIRRLRRAGAMPIPEVHGIDKKLRWSRAEVEKFVARGGVMPAGRRRAA
jgi:excisionase family DNA binding protein